MEKFLAAAQEEYFKKIHEYFERLVIENIDGEFSPDFLSEGWGQVLHDLTADMPTDLEEQAEYLECVAQDAAERLYDEHQFELEEIEED